MKTIYVCLFALLVVLAACKKDDGDDPTTSSSTSSMYSVKAPSCLITHANVYSIDFYFSYDNQKRLIRQSAVNDSLVVSYTYIGNTIRETSTLINDDGSTSTYSSLWYLNTAGWVDSAIQEDLGGAYTTLYQYNSTGYLIRKLSRSPEGEVRPVAGYQYSGGNRIASYRINTDWEGTVTDSVIDETYTYYSNIKGSTEEWGAWVNRTGRGNANEIKTIQNDNSVDTRIITMGANNLPSKIDVTSGSNTNSLALSWKCN